VVITRSPFIRREDTIAFLFFEIMVSCYLYGLIGLTSWRSQRIQTANFLFAVVIISIAGACIKFIYQVGHDLLLLRKWRKKRT